MDKQYFPHTTGGSLNSKYTYKPEFNMMPNAPITVDPRTIITEWTDDALATLLSSEVFEGLEILSLNDGIKHTCRWIPESGRYSALQCIWEDNSITELQTPLWIDATTYSPKKTLTEQIEMAKKKNWQLNITQNFGYFGFYDFNLIEGQTIKTEIAKETILNNVLLTLVNGSADNDTLSSSIQKLLLKAGEKTLTIPPIKTSAAYDSALDGNLIILIPESANIKISKITFMGIDYTDGIYVLNPELQFVKMTLPYNYDYADYYIYAVPTKLSVKEGISIKVTFEKIS